MSRSLAFFFCFAPHLASAEVNWPQFRGPNGDGHATAQRVPVKWGDADHVAWKAAVPGRGWSSPAIGDGLLWVTTAVEKPADERQLTNARLKLLFNPMAKEMKIVGAISLKAVALDLATGEVKREVPLFEVADPQPVHSLNTLRFAESDPRRAAAVLPLRHVRHRVRQHIHRQHRMEDEARQRALRRPGQFAGAV